MPAVTLTDSDFIEYDASNPLPVTPTGGGPGGEAEVSIPDGADIALGSTTDDAYVGTEPYTAMAALRAIANAAISALASPVNLTQTGGNALAADAAAAGTTVPVPIGGTYLSAAPPTYTNGQRTQLQTTSDGSVRVLSLGINVTPADGQTNVEADLGVVASAAGSRRLGVFPYVYNSVSGGWDRMRNTGVVGGAQVVENGPYTASRVTADGQVKATAGFIHTVTFSPTGTVTAGTITIYNSAAESGTVVMSVALPITTFTPFSVVLDAVCGTGIYVGYDGTVANVQVTVSFR